MSAGVHKRSRTAPPRRITTDCQCNARSAQWVPPGVAACCREHPEACEQFLRVPAQPGRLGDRLLVCRPLVGEAPKRARVLPDAEGALQPQWRLTHAEGEPQPRRPVEIGRNWWNGPPEPQGT